jgi:hypothetical protein
MKLSKNCTTELLFGLELVFFSTDESTKSCRCILFKSPQYSFHLLWSKQNIKSNFAEGKTGLPENAVSALQTSLIGVFISIGGLVAYSYMQGGDEYIASLSASFYLAESQVMTYGVSLL